VGGIVKSWRAKKEHGKLFWCVRNGWLEAIKQAKYGVL
jgi:hypothetical protein